MCDCHICRAIRAGYAWLVDAGNGLLYVQCCTGHTYGHTAAVYGIAYGGRTEIDLHVRG